MEAVNPKAPDGDVDSIIWHIAYDIAQSFKMLRYADCREFQMFSNRLDTSIRNLDDLVSTYDIETTKITPLIESIITLRTTSDQISERLGGPHLGFALRLKLRDKLKTLESLTFEPKINPVFGQLCGVENMDEWDVEKYSSFESELQAWMPRLGKNQSENSLSVTQINNLLRNKKRELKEIPLRCGLAGNNEDSNDALKPLLDPLDECIRISDQYKLLCLTRSR